MKEAIEKLEAILNQGLYGREEEIRLALLCTLSDKTLLLYGHDDAKEILLRFEALFGTTPIHVKPYNSINTLKKNKLNKYTAYCGMTNHNNPELLYEYLFTQNTNVLSKLQQVAPDAQKLKKFFQDYNFANFWNEENKAKAINFIESLLAHVNPTGQEDNMEKQFMNIPDKRFKDFLHLLAVNLIMNDRKEIVPVDFGMFFYCLRDWEDGLKYLETTICLNLSNELLPTFIFHDDVYERECKEKFTSAYENSAMLIPNLEYMFYVPYSSAPNTQPNDMFVTLGAFYQQYTNLLQEVSNEDLAELQEELQVKKEILKAAQLQEMELKETQLAQVQLKRSAFKSVKDGLDERLKIAGGKEKELREQREILEGKFKDAKIRDQREGLEAQIAEIQAKENQYKEIYVSLDRQLQDAKNVLEDKLKQVKAVLEEKAIEVRQKEQELYAIQEQVNNRLTNQRNIASIRIKEAKDYLTQLRTLPVGLNKAIESCKQQIDIVSRPNPVWVNPLKLHLNALYKIQKNIPNMIRAFDSQVKKYEENSKKLV